MKYLIILTVISVALNIFLAFKLRKKTEDIIETIEHTSGKWEGIAPLENIKDGDNRSEGIALFNTGATSKDRISDQYWGKPNEGLTTGNCNTQIGFGPGEMKAGTKGDFPVNRIGFYNTKDTTPHWREDDGLNNVMYGNETPKQP